MMKVYPILEGKVAIIKLGIKCVGGHADNRGNGGKQHIQAAGNIK